MDFDEAFDLLEDLTEEEVAELNSQFNPEAHGRIMVENRLPNLKSVGIKEPEPVRLVKLKPTPIPKSATPPPLPEPTDEGNMLIENSSEEDPAHERIAGQPRLPFGKPIGDKEPERIIKLKPTPIPTARTPSPLPELTDEENALIDNASEEELAAVAENLKSKYGGSAEINPAMKLRKALVQPQYTEKSIDEEDEMEETIDVDALLRGLRTEGEDISIIVCNNQPYMEPEILEEIAAHLNDNKIRHLSLANCNVTDGLMESLAEAVENNTVLQTLNLESNFISPVGIKALLDAVEKNTTLRELRVENQYSKIGPKCESEMIDMVKKNFTLLNFGYAFETKGPRDAMSRHILRNNDLLREKRKRGETNYNLAQEKHLIRQFKPPWMKRKPRRKGGMEGRQHIVKGQSKGQSKTKKKGGGGILMSEMLNRAAQVSQRWEDKSQNGELDKEYNRIEAQSKLTLEEQDRRKEKKHIRAIEERIRAREEAKGNEQGLDNDETDGDRGEEEPAR